MVYKSIADLVKEAEKKGVDFSKDDVLSNFIKSLGPGGDRFVLLRGTDQNFVSYHPDNIEDVVRAASGNRRKTPEEVERARLKQERADFISR